MRGYNCRSMRSACLKTFSAGINLQKHLVYTFLLFHFMFFSLRLPFHGKFSYQYSFATAADDVSATIAVSTVNRHLHEARSERVSIHLRYGHWSSGAGR